MPGVNINNLLLQYQFPVYPFSFDQYRRSRWSEFIYVCASCSRDVNVDSAVELNELIK